ISPGTAHMRHASTLRRNGSALPFGLPFGTAIPHPGHENFGGLLRSIGNIAQVCRLILNEQEDYLPVRRPSTHEEESFLPSSTPSPERWS
ncbi:MAG: hypothetical protein AAFV29_10765, partial [Myxococcota bacterium]